MVREDALGFLVRSRFKQNADDEGASLFHAARELKNAKNNILKLKIDGRVVADENIIEDEITKFFFALFNGHHGQNLGYLG